MKNLGLSCEMLSPAGTQHDTSQVIFLIFLTAATAVQLPRNREAQIYLKFIPTWPLRCERPRGLL